MSNLTSSSHNYAHIRDIGQGIRKRVLEYTVKNNGGYLSQACSSAEIFSVLYVELMNLAKASEPMLPKKFSAVPSPHNHNYERGFSYNGAHAPDLDRFFLSPTHYSLVLYATLVETNRMVADGLNQFNCDGSTVEMIGAEHSPGMEIMTGSLGQGISQAAGIAMARKLKGDTGKVWIFMSDGELQSGQAWEAFAAMAFYKLDNIRIYVDVNGYQCDGQTKTVMSLEPLEKRLETFGLQTKRVAGHDISALILAGKSCIPDKPLAVICDTCPWQGIPLLKERAPKLHYIRFKDEKERQAYYDLLHTW